MKARKRNMKIAIGADHGGFDLKAVLVGHLQGQGHQVLDVGTGSTGAVDYPVFARKVAEAVSTGQARRARQPALRQSRPAGAAMWPAQAATW